MHALGANETGANNVAGGSGALDACTTGNHNVGVGYQALSALTDAQFCVAIGKDAGLSNISGDSLTLVGYHCGDAMETAATTVAMGVNAAGAGTSCVDVTAIGDNAGNAITSGSYNTVVGQAAGDTITTGAGNTVVGAACDVSATGAANQIVLGQNFTSPGDNTFAFGKSGNIVQNTFTSNANWAQSSDERLKTNVNDNTLGLDFINDMQTKTYNWKPSNEVPKELTRHYSEINKKDTDVLMYGMMAQEVKSAMDKHGNPNFTGWLENDDGSQDLSREMFVVPLIKAVQELSAKVEELEKKLNG